MHGAITYGSGLLRFRFGWRFTSVPSAMPACPIRNVLSCSRIGAVTIRRGCALHAGTDQGINCGGGPSHRELRGSDDVVIGGGR